MGVSDTMVGENDTVALEENSMYREFKSRREEENLNDNLNGLNLSPWNGEEDNLQALAIKYIIFFSVGEGYCE